MNKFNNDRLGVLLVGLGSVGTTTIAGVEAIKRKMGRPVGSLTQMGRLNKMGVSQSLIKDVLPLASLDQLVFGAWDIFPDDAYTAALEAGVLDRSLLKNLKASLSSIRPMKGVYSSDYLKAIHGAHTKKSARRQEWVKQIQNDFRHFLDKNRCGRAVMVLCSSTEISHKKPQPQTLQDFERRLNKNDGSLSPSMIYTYAALNAGIPVINATPNNWGDASYLEELSASTQTPYAGSDLKTGQTMIKSVIAPALRRRMLGVKGWFSTNILGNRDGLVLSEQGSFFTKKKSKEEGLLHLLSAKEFPELYGNLVHLVDINYFPPKGDNKEGWDNIDLYGWLDYPMQIKINFLCRDSILAAPLILDLILLLDYAKRSGLSGGQDWLGFYFKSPTTGSSGTRSHDLTEQHQMLMKQLKWFVETLPSKDKKAAPRRKR